MALVILWLSRDVLILLNVSVKEANRRYFLDLGDLDLSSVVTMSMRVWSLS